MTMSEMRTLFELEMIDDDLFGAFVGLLHNSGVIRRKSNGSGEVCVDTQWLAREVISSLNDLKRFAVNGIVDEHLLLGDWLTVSVATKVRIASELERFELAYPLPRLDDGTRRWMIPLLLPEWEAIAHFHRSVSNIHAVPLLCN